eukprot:m.98593 g.98593  ORF g.98593 m.98593 type:complete len:211 (-) comp16754_c0_seq1:343-975(-)
MDIVDDSESQGCDMDTGPPRGLFGGAITALIPLRFKDVSQFRQVPDNQEVFVDADADQSFIIEIVEKASEASDMDAAKFHFHSIAHDNEATETIIESAPDGNSLAPNFNGTRSICIGRQRVSKYNEKERRGVQSGNIIRVYVSCFRLTDVATDIVISFNSPVQISNDSSSARAVVAESVAVHATPDAAANEFSLVTNSFFIRDMTLFQPE